MNRLPIFVMFAVLFAQMGSPVASYADESKDTSTPRFGEQGDGTREGGGGGTLDHLVRDELEFVAGEISKQDPAAGKSIDKAMKRRHWLSLQATVNDPVHGGELDAYTTPNLMMLKSSWAEAQMQLPIEMRDHLTFGHELLRMTRTHDDEGYKLSKHVYGLDQIKIVDPVVTGDFSNCTLSFTPESIRERRRISVQASNQCIRHQTFKLSLYADGTPVEFSIKNSIVVSPSVSNVKSFYQYVELPGVFMDPLFLGSTENIPDTTEHELRVQDHAGRVVSTKWNWKKADWMHDPELIQHYKDVAQKYEADHPMICGDTGTILTTSSTLFATASPGSSYTDIGAASKFTLLSKHTFGSDRLLYVSITQAAGAEIPFNTGYIYLGSTDLDRRCFK